jgi:hypothetical protein
VSPFGYPCAARSGMRAGAILLDDLGAGVNFESFSGEGVEKGQLLEASLHQGRNGECGVSGVGSNDRPLVVRVRIALDCRNETRAQHCSRRAGQQRFANGFPIADPVGTIFRSDRPPCLVPVPPLQLCLAAWLLLADNTGNFVERRPFIR